MSDTRQKAHETLDAYLNAGGSSSFVIMSQTDAVRNNMMSGREWFEMFKQQLAIQPTEPGVYAPIGYVWEGAVLAAARRAAGLEGEQS